MEPTPLNFDQAIGQVVCCSRGEFTMDHGPKAYPEVIRKMLRIEPVLSESDKQIIIEDAQIVDQLYRLALRSSFHSLERGRFAKKEKYFIASAQPSMVTDHQPLNIPDLFAGLPGETPVKDEAKPGRKPKPKSKSLFRRLIPGASDSKSEPQPPPLPEPQPNARKLNEAEKCGTIAQTHREAGKNVRDRYLALKREAVESEKLLKDTLRYRSPARARKRAEQDLQDTLEQLRIEAEGVKEADKNRQDAEIFRLTSEFEARKQSLQNEKTILRDKAVAELEAEKALLLHQLGETDELELSGMQRFDDLIDFANELNPRR